MLENLSDYALASLVIIIVLIIICAIRQYKKEQAPFDELFKLSHDNLKKGAELIETLERRKNHV